MGERPVISPSITDNGRAVKIFVRLAKSISSNGSEVFARTTGKAALNKLQDAAKAFEAKHLR